jgi:integral membrane protein
MLKTFRIISLIEGLSLIALFFIAMPAKYYFDYPHLVPYIGMAHGMLWLLYIVASLSTSHQQKWSVFYWMFMLVLSVIPLGFIFVEIKCKDPAANDNHDIAEA